MNQQDLSGLDELARYLESQIPGRKSAQSAPEPPPAELVERLFARQLSLNQAASAVLARRSSAVRSESVRTLAQIPAIPIAAFKGLELTTVPASQRVAVFHSSGTTQHEPSRHYHSRATLGIYRLALEAWFKQRMLGDFPWAWQLKALEPRDRPQFISLTPTPETAPNSSLAYMIGTLANRFGNADTSSFHGNAASTGWEVDFPSLLITLRQAANSSRPVIISGTAFNFVHLLDELERIEFALDLPPGSRVMETGGYKGRSRTVSKSELRELITARLGVPSRFIATEYGMSELSSQAYDVDFSLDRPVIDAAKEMPRMAGCPDPADPCADHAPRRRGEDLATDLAAQPPTIESRLSSSPLGPPRGRLQFPPWCHPTVVSPETGKEVPAGTPGLLRIADLANVASVMAIQTEDLAVLHPDGLELLGRATLAEPRGCSLLSVAAGEEL